MKSCIIFLLIGFGLFIKIEAQVDNQNNTTIFTLFADSISITFELNPKRAEAKLEIENLNHSTIVLDTSSFLADYSLIKLYDSSFTFLDSLYIFEAVDHPEHLDVHWKVKLIKVPSYHTVNFTVHFSVPDSLKITTNYFHFVTCYLKGDYINKISDGESMSVSEWNYFKNHEIDFRNY